MAALRQWGAATVPRKKTALRQSLEIPCGFSNRHPDPIDVLDIPPFPHHHVTTSNQGTEVGLGKYANRLAGRGLRLPSIEFLNSFFSSVVSGRNSSLLPRALGARGTSSVCFLISLGAALRGAFQMRLEMPAGTSRMAGNRREPVAATKMAKRILSTLAP